MSVDILEREAVEMPSLLMDLEPGEVAAKRILAKAEPLRSDTEYQKQFRGEMGVVAVTLERAPDVSGYTVYLWDETVQPSGSYKTRGASNAVLRTNPTDTLWTYSTGNHATSVAIAGKRRGQRVVAEMPENVSSVKEKRVLSSGAIVSKFDPLTDKPHRTFQDAEATAKYAGEQSGVSLIDPFGHPDVVAGQCSAGFEMVEEIIAKGLAHKNVIIPVPVAGGGYINGIAIPIWEAKQQGRLGEGIRVVAVQPEGTDAMSRALDKIQSGQEPLELFGTEGPDTDCDALAITESSLSPLTMAVVADKDFVDGCFTLDKARMGKAMFELTKLRRGRPVEPAAALAYAFAQHYAETFPASSSEPVTFITPITGQNVSHETRMKYQFAVNESVAAELAHSSVVQEHHIRQRTRTRQANTVGKSVTHNVLSGTFTRSRVSRPRSGWDKDIDYDGVRAAYLAQLAEMGIELIA